MKYYYFLHKTTDKVFRTKMYGFLGREYKVLSCLESATHVTPNWKVEPNYYTVYRESEGWQQITEEKVKQQYPHLFKDKKYSAVKLLKEAGFRKYDINLNAFGIETFKSNGLLIACSEKDTWTMAEFVKRIADQAAYLTRKRIKDKVSAIDFGIDGFVV